MFALARFAILIAQLYIGFSIAGIGVVLIAKGLLMGLVPWLFVPVGAVVIWVAYKAVAALERVRERLSDV